MVLGKNFMFGAVAAVISAFFLTVPVQAIVTMKRQMAQIPMQKSHLFGTIAQAQTVIWHHLLTENGKQE